MCRKIRNLAISVPRDLGRDLGWLRAWSRGSLPHFSLSRANSPFLSREYRDLGRELGRGGLTPCAPVSTATKVARQQVATLTAWFSPFFHFFFFFYSHHFSSPPPNSSTSSR
ncbi:hypothetical protein ACOSQ4_014387 [Xanthoceras sorbifolium]